MRRRILLPMATSVLGLCAVVAGCTQRFGAHNRNLPSVTQPAGCAEASDALPRPTALSAAPNEMDVPAVQDPHPSFVGSRLVVREVAEPIATECSDASPFLVQYMHSPNFGPEVVPLPQGVPAEPRSAGAKPATAPNSDPLITLRVDNMDVGKVMEMISRQAKILNILVSPGVGGKITVDLRGKTVDEALRIIAKQCRLTVLREGDVIYISTLEESRKIAEDDLPVRVYHLNYVKSKDIEVMIKPLLSKKGRLTASPESDTGLATDASHAGDKAKDVKAGGDSMAGGDIVVIQDYEDILIMVDRVIAQIDVQPIQVLIEAVIVKVKLDKGMELGVNFALLDGAGQALGIAGSGAAINAGAGFLPASVLSATKPGYVKGTPLAGFAKAEPGLKFGFVDKSTTGFLKALETMGETKVLACPRLLVLNKQRAEIHLGKKLGYKTSTVSQTSTTETVEFQDIGTQLRLRPFVAFDGMIRMEVRPERSSGEIDKEGIPQVDATQVTTNVMIPSGATLVIGGLMESNVSHGWAGLPFLSRLPVIGYLFRETIDDTTNTELVVLITPHIWRPQTPDALNYLGRPRTLGLDKRVSQRPREERRDGPSLYELARPEVCPQEAYPDDTFQPPPAGHTISVGRAPTKLK